MRGIQAKRIRKQVYGDHSIQDRKYETVTHPQRVLAVVGTDILEQKIYFATTLRALGKRREYQDAKKEYKRTGTI